MGKQASQAFKPHEVEAMARQQNRMNNPNITNTFGSTTTEFGEDDQAQITQTLSPEMQAIIDSQMNFVGQGPAQLGNFSNPFMEQMMQGAANGIARRGGYGAGDAGMMGGFQGSSPQFNQQSDPMAVDPMAPMNLPQGGNGLPTVGATQGAPNPALSMGMTEQPIQAPQEQSPVAGLAQALSSYGGQGGGASGGGSFNDLGANLAMMMNRNRVPDPTTQGK